MDLPRMCILHTISYWKQNSNTLTEMDQTTASVKDWCKSPHGITGPPDQSSRNSGNKCQLARPQTLPIFVVLWEKVCEISAVENLCSPKVDQSLPKSLKTCYAPMPVITSNFIATVYEKSVTNLFYTLYYFCAAGGPPGPKFTSLGGDV